MNNIQNMSPGEQAQFMDELENIQMHDQVLCLIYYDSRRLSSRDFFSNFLSMFSRSWLSKHNVLSTCLI